MNALLTMLSRVFFVRITHLGYMNVIFYQGTERMTRRSVLPCGR